MGKHEAPLFSELHPFLSKWKDRYAGLRQGETSIVALAAAHHRMAWMHPFLDGNGRVVRLHAIGLTNGLWSPLRGFARLVDQYRTHLQMADDHRRGDLDSRGNLTQAGLVDWIGYVLDTCIDQAKCMTSQLDIQGVRDRIAAALAFEEDVVKSGVRKEALFLLHYLFSTRSELPRGRSQSIAGNEGSADHIDHECITSARVFGN